MSLSDEVIYLEFEPLWKGLKPIYKEEKIDEPCECGDCERCLEEEDEVEV